MYIIVTAVTYLAQPLHALAFIACVSGFLLSVAGVCMYLEKRGVL